MRARIVVPLWVLLPCVTVGLVASVAAVIGVAGAPGYRRDHPDGNAGGSTAHAVSRCIRSPPASQRKPRIVTVLGAGHCNTF
jgi:hypothetical protein